MPKTPIEMLIDKACGIDDIAKLREMLSVFAAGVAEDAVGFALGFLDLEEDPRAAFCTAAARDFAVTNAMLNPTPKDSPGTMPWNGGSHY